MEDDIEWVNRDRGILNQRDRELLMNEGEDISDNAWNQRRYNIRRRICDSILDFSILIDYLPLADIQQVFEPAYDWSREKRDLAEEGRPNANPDVPTFIRGWMAAFELFAYGMHAGGKEEARGLMAEVVREGMERGTRHCLVENSNVVREVTAEFDLQYGHEVLWQNYMQQFADQLPNQTDKAAEEIFRLYRERRIPYRLAAHWLEQVTEQPRY